MSVTIFAFVRFKPIIGSEFGTIQGVGETLICAIGRINVVGDGSLTLSILFRAIGEQRQTVV